MTLNITTVELDIWHSHCQGHSLHLVREIWLSIVYIVQSILWYRMENNRQHSHFTLLLNIASLIDILTTKFSTIIFTHYPIYISSFHIKNTVFQGSKKKLRSNYRQCNWYMIKPKNFSVTSLTVRYFSFVQKLSNITAIFLSATNSLVQIVCTLWEICWGKCILSHFPQNNFYNMWQT